MHRALSLSAGVVCCIGLVSGCSDLVGWGELGDEVSAGPYRFSPPKRFKTEPQGSGQGETRIMYRGPASGESEPGILVMFTPHNMDLNQYEPNWSEAVRMGTGALKMQCEPNTFSCESGSLTTFNNLPGIRVKFTGVFRHGSESRAMHGIGYMMCDDGNLVMVVGMDFGPQGEANVAKLETSFKTIHRPGFNTPSYSWMTGGQPPSGGLAGGPGGSGTGVPGPPSPPRTRPPSFAGSAPGSAYPGSGPGSSYPGSLAPPDSAGPSGQAGTGAESGGSTRSPEETKRLREEMERRNQRLAAAKSASHPDYFPANLEMLRDDEDHEVRNALERLTSADPNSVADNELRKNIARAIREIAFDRNASVWKRQKAVPALVVWGSTFSVPLLIDLLEDQERFVQEEALTGLATLKDERAIEPVVRLFVSEVGLRSEAADCLRVFGSAAEPKVLELVQATDFIITRETVKLLGDIGTTKCLKSLRSLSKLSFYRLIEGDVTEALDKIKARRKSDEPDA